MVAQNEKLGHNGATARSSGGSVTAAITLPNTDQSRNYTLDGLGNWKTSVYTPAGGNYTTDQRSHNYVNQITQVIENPPGALTAFEYDSHATPTTGNGNLTNDGTLIYAYDAYNRLIQVNRVSDGLIIATYVYDAVNRRVRKTIFNGGLTGRVPNSTTGTWGVTQRYVYSPYGTITVLNADWSTPPVGTQPLVNNLYQVPMASGMDSVAGLYYERNRNHPPSLGSVSRQDPLQYINGANTYQFVMGNPVGHVDPWGTAEYLVDPIGGGGGDLESDPGGVLETGGIPGYPSEGAVGPSTDPVNKAVLSNAAQSSAACPVQPWPNGPGGPMMNPKYGFPKVPTPPPPPLPPPNWYFNPPGPVILPNGQFLGFWD